jgi:hypothetical protein
MSEIISIPNIEKYKQEIIDGTLILTPKVNYITLDQFNKLNFNNSKILKSSINNNENTISNKLNYRSLLNDIWLSMPTQKILQNTKFNMKLTNEKGIKGYVWYPKLNLSIQNKDANNTIKEILNMIKINNYSITLTIQLETNEIVNFKFPNYI